MEIKKIRLYDLPQRAKKRPKIYCDASDGSKYIEFDHLDGMYSYCVTEKGGVVHLAGTAPLKKFKDGYKIAKE